MRRGPSTWTFAFASALVLALTARVCASSGIATLSRTVAPVRELDEDTIATRAAEFSRWINLASVAPSVRLVHDERLGWSLIAAADIAAGERVITVPLSRILSWRSAERTAVGAVMKSLAKSFDASAALIIHLLAEASLARRSEWQPYLQMLPDGWDLPVFWSRDQLDELQASELVADSESAVDDVKRSYETLIRPLLEMRPDLFDATSFSKRAYLWAKTVLWSRSMALPLDPSVKSRARALVPLVDFLKFNRTGNVQLEFAPMLLAQTAVASRAIAKGETLCVTAPGGNADMLFTHGIVFDDAPDGALFRWPLVLAADVRARELRVSVLNKHKFEPTDSAVLYDGPTVNPDVLAFARVALGPQGPLAAPAFKPYAPLADSAAERRVLVALRGAMATRLANYATSEADDTALLAAGVGAGEDGDARVRMAIVVRRDEKRVLRVNVATLDAMIAALPAPEPTPAPAPTPTPAPDAREL